MQIKDEPARETLHITQTSAEYDVWTIEKYLRLAHPTIVHRGVFVMSRLDDSSKRPRQKRHVNEGGDDGMGIPADGESGFPLLHIDERYHNFDDLIVTDETKDRLMSIVLECTHAKRLLAFGFSPESKILLCGPPGTGKTLSARVISSEIGYPFAYVHFDSIVSSLLGQTATNLRVLLAKSGGRHSPGCRPGSCQGRFEKFFQNVNRFNHAYQLHLPGIIPYESE